MVLTHAPTGRPHHCFVSQRALSAPASPYNTARFRDVGSASALLPPGHRHATSAPPLGYLDASGAQPPPRPRGPDTSLVPHHRALSTSLANTTRAARPSERELSRPAFR